MCMWVHRLSTCNRLSPDCGVAENKIQSTHSSCMHASTRSGIALAASSVQARDAFQGPAGPALPGRLSEYDPTLIAVPAIAEDRTHPNHLLQLWFQGCTKAAANTPAGGTAMAIQITAIRSSSSKILCWQSGTLASIACLRHWRVVPCENTYEHVFGIGTWRRCPPSAAHQLRQVEMYPFRRNKVSSFYHHQEQRTAAMTTVFSLQVSRQR